MITGTVPVKVPEKLSDLELDAGGKRIDNLGLGDTPDDVMRRSEKTVDYGVYGLVQTGLAADRPAPGIVDRLYFSTDTLVLERDTGAAWVEVVRGEAAIRLAQLAERAHTSLTGIGVADHHARYTDVEAQAQAAALIVIHTAIAAAHHAKTTDAGEIVSGTFPVARGGTGLSTIALGGILYASALDVLSRLAPTTANQVLRSTAANALQFAALLAADIPNLPASKITSGRFPVDRLPAMTDEKIWKGTGANVEEVDMPAAGWTPTGDGGTKVAAADIEDAAGIPLTKLEAAVCSETEADDKIAALLELIGESSPSEAANVEFTGLSGDIFLVFFSLFGSSEGRLYLRLNGIETSDYRFRQFLNGTTITALTSQVRFTLSDISTSYPISGCLIITGKRIGANNRLNVALFGTATEYDERLMINGSLIASAGDLSSINLYPSTGTFTGKVKLYKVV